MPPRWNREPFGRIVNDKIPARIEPEAHADVLVWLRKDDVIRIKRVVIGETVFSNNDLWLETEHGYLYASFVQPIQYHLPNPPRSNLGEGRWAELTVPYADALRRPDPFDEDAFVSRLYYGSTVRVTELVADDGGQMWYRVDELYMHYYMRAAHLNLIDKQDLSPISPQVDPQDKRIEVNLTEQTLVAYEGDQPVFAHLISSGIAQFATPEGVHYVLDKRISERMVGGIDNDKYNLPGVAFVCYFTWNWAATHGCYWHNDWGRQRSHGCLNLPSQAARWLWRWTTPYPDLDVFYERPSNRLDGTRVEVSYG